MRNVAVLGATGLVGEEVIKILEQRDFPIKELYLFASERSEGQTRLFKDSEVEIVGDLEPLVESADIIFGCLDADLSREIIPRFKGKGVVIDNSNAYRMDPQVPLVVPEVNPEKAKEHKGIIANPNCSTIQMVVPLYPLHRARRIKRIFVATYQSVSGYGRDAITELRYETECMAMQKTVDKQEDSVFVFPIANNLIPQIGGFNELGYTSEEMKMVNETRKIFGDDSIMVTATCVRIPVILSHSEAVSVDFEQPITPDEAKQVLAGAPGIKLFETDDKYPMPLCSANRDLVFVGRIRKDFVFDNGLAMWIVADNIRKGAALNAVQIAELLI